MQVLLMGLGRMGQRYLNVLKDLYGDKLSLYTIDPLMSGPDSKTHFKTLNETPQISFDLAIDAHPNEGRSEILHEFIKRKIQRVIVEKPHAKSIEESAKMNVLAKDSSTQVMLPFYRYFFPALKLETLNQIDAGKLIGVQSISGAIGFGCNGVHYLDMASRLLGGDPMSVYGQLGINSIPSPRGPQFLDHDGLMIVNYPKGTYTLTVKADSSIGISTTFQFENGKIILNEQAGANWTWWRRPEDARNLPMTRTSMEKEIPPPMPYELNLEKLIHSGIKDFMAGKTVPTLADGHRTLKTIALGIASTESGRKVNWNENSLIQNTNFAFT